MPNVEIIGFGDKTAETRDRMRGLLRGIGYGEDAVTTSHFTAKVETCTTEPESAPYIRIFSTEFGYIEPIIDAMSHSAFHEDIEVAFFPYVYIEKTQMRMGRWKKTFNRKMWFWKLLHYCKLMK